MPLNSLYSLYAHQLADPAAFAAADRLLFIPDLLHYWLSGERTIEATIASTSQMIDCHTGDWARDMLARTRAADEHLGDRSLRRHDDRHASSAARGRNRPAAHACKSSCPAAHDTASAVAAVPANDAICELVLSFERHVVAARRGARRSRACRRRRKPASFTNELGVDGTFRFLKNIAGLWLVQECRRDFARQGQEFDYATLTQLASRSAAAATIVDPAHASFHIAGRHAAENRRIRPGDGQPAPESPGEFIRCCAGKPRARLSRKARHARINSRPAVRRASHRRRRRQEYAALANDGRRHWPARRRRSVRSDGDGQRPRPSDGDWAKFATSPTCGKSLRSRASSLFANLLAIRTGMPPSIVTSA